MQTTDDRKGIETEREKKFVKDNKNWCGDKQKQLRVYIDM